MHNSILKLIIQTCIIITFFTNLYALNTNLPNSNLQTNDYSSTSISLIKRYNMNSSKNILTNFHIDTTGFYNLSGYCLTPTPVVEVSHYDELNAIYRVKIQDHFAYLLDQYYGLVILDIQDPENPVEVGRLELSTYSYALDIKDNYAYIATYSSSSYYFNIIDISNKTNSIITGQLNYKNPIYGITIRDNFAYIANKDDGLRIIDISNPYHPVEISQYDTPGSSYEIYINENLAYLADYTTGLRIIDVSDPTKPMEIGYWMLTTFAFTYDVIVHDNYAYVSNGFNGLQILDVTNPSIPIEISRFTTGSFTYNVNYQKPYIYLSDRNNGLRIIDVSNSYYPVEIDYYNSSGYAYQVYLDQQYAYLADYYSGLRIIKIARPLNDVTLTLSGDTNLMTTTDSTGYYEFQNLIYDISLSQYTVQPFKDGYNFYPNERSYQGIYYSNISNQNYWGISSESNNPPERPINISPEDNLVISNTTPIFISSPFFDTDGEIHESSQWQIDNHPDFSSPIFNTGELASNTSSTVPVNILYHDISYWWRVRYKDSHGSWSYWSNSTKFTLSSITNYLISGLCTNIPNNGIYPQVAFLKSSQDLTAIKIQGNYAYLADYYSGLEIIDISNPSSPIKIGSLSENIRTRRLEVQGNLAYIAQSSYGLSIIDISNPHSPNHISRFTTSGYTHDVAVRGNYAYLVNHSDGLQILDIGNPSNPQLIGKSTAISYGEEIALQGDYAFIANNYYGMDIINISNPTNPVKVGQTKNINAYDILVNGNYVYLLEYIYYTSSNTHLYIIDISNLSSPSTISSYIINESTLPYQSYGLELVNDFLFVSNANKGFKVFNIENPINPVLVGQSTSSFARDVKISGNYAYVPDYYNGLRVYQLSEPISNVTLSLSGDTNLATTSDTTGYYEFTNLTFGNYTVTPIKEKTIISPSNRVFSNLNQNQLNQDFNGYSTISISFLSSPDNIQIHINGENFLTPYTFSTTLESFLTIGVNSPYDFDTGIRLAFKSWSDGGSQTHIINPSTNTSYTVSFDTQYYLTTQSNPVNGGTIYPSDNWYINGSLINLYAIPSDGYRFDSWGGDISGNSNPYILTMNSPKNIIAYFSVQSSSLPNVPTNLQAEALNHHHIQLTWQDNSNNEYGFGMDMKIDEGPWEILDWVGIDVTSYQHLGLNQGHTYCYRIYTWNPNGLSGYSNDACAELIIEPTGIMDNIWHLFE